MSKMTNSTPRPRGRPKGSRDSYPRQRSFTKKQPLQTTLEIVMPQIHNLIEAAKTQGIAIGAGRPYEPAQEEVERATTILLAAIKEVISIKRILSQYDRGEKPYY